MLTSYFNPGDSSRLTDVVSAMKNYPMLWERTIQDWQSSHASNFAWLTYSANYIFHTAGLRWGIDPFSLSSRIEGVKPPNYVSALRPISLIALTHTHADHLDNNLITSLAHLPITWIIPGFVREAVQSTLNLPDRQIITPKVGTPIRFGPLVLSPINALHFRDGHGVPEMGYLAEFDGMRWLFPGDTRSFDFDQLPEFGDLDGVFAHLWLGKACAKSDAPPLLDDFISFFSSFTTRRLVLSHLYEFGRDEHDRWEDHHFHRVKQEIQRKRPDVQVEMALIGDRIDLGVR